MRPWLFVVALVACGDDGPGLDPDAGPTADARPDSDPSADLMTVPAGCVPDRVTADRPDDLTFDQIRVLYVLPSDGQDRMRDTNGQICNSARAFATWFHARANQYLRLDTQGGMIDIGFVRLGKTDAQMRGTDPNNQTIETGTAFVRERIERELDQMGLVASNKLYAVYYEGSSVYACGGGAYPPLIEDRVGAMYLQGMPPGVTTPCGEGRPWGLASLKPNYVDYGMLHELVHSLGFVADSAPHEHASGHVYDPTTEPNRDLMYSPRTTADPGWNIDHVDGLVLDIGRDDYYETAPALDLEQSSLLAPLGANAKRPIGW